MKLMYSGRLALVFFVVFATLVGLQLSELLAELNVSVYQVISSFSGEGDDFLIRRMAYRVTGLGDTGFCIALACLVLFWGWSVGSMPVARGFCVAMIAVATLNTTLKVLIAAPRPESGQWMASYSFPSGHASAAVAAWSMLAIIAVMGERRLTLRFVVAGLLACVGLAVAASRVIIGVHWPMDVLTGTFEGLFIAAAFYRLVYQRKGGAKIVTHDPQLLLGMTAVMSVIYVIL